MDSPLQSAFLKISARGTPLAMAADVDAPRTEWAINDSSTPASAKRSLIHCPAFEMLLDCLGERMTESTASLQTLVVRTLQFSPHKTFGIPSHINVHHQRRQPIRPPWGEYVPGILYLVREANLNTTPFGLLTLNRMSRALSSDVLLAFTKAITTTSFWLSFLRERDLFKPIAAKCLVITSTSHVTE